MKSPSGPRVALVDDHSIFAESLAIALGLEGYDAQRVPVETAGSPGVLLTEILKLRPRTALIDLNLGFHGDGSRLVRPLTEMGVATVVVTASTMREQWGACIAVGARAVIPKLAPLKEIVATICRLHEGLPVMSTEQREELLQCWRDHIEAERDARARLERLTRREAEVLGMLMTGLQVTDIAKQRFVSESTVRTQVKAVLAKLQVSSQLTAVGLANRVGWQPPQEQEPRRGENLRVPRPQGPRSVHQR